MRYKWTPGELHVKKDRNAITVKAVEMDRSLVFESKDVYCFKRGFLTDGVSAPAFAKVFIPYQEPHRLHLGHVLDRQHHNSGTDDFPFESVNRAHPFPKILRRNSFHLCIWISVGKRFGDAAFLFRIPLEFERLDF